MYQSRLSLIIGCMKLESKFFDSIRVSGKRSSGPKREERAPICQWKGCEKPGPHRAPMGRGKDGQYYNFCVDHVRQYNQSYNYFDGMSDADVDKFRKDAITGHRPTWKSGANAWSHGTREGARSADMGQGPGLNAHFASRAKKARAEAPENRRQLRPLERKAMRTLDLPENAQPADIKAKFKELVKLHHPDANGGDSRSEDTLREIIQAYNYLKQAGMVS